MFTDNLPSLQFGNTVAAAPVDLEPLSHGLPGFESDNSSNQLKPDTTQQKKQAEIPPA
jgi:hypothetical protein